MEEADIEVAINAIKKKGGQIRQKADNEKGSASEKKQSKEKVKDKKKLKKANDSVGQNGKNSDESESSSSDSDSEDSDFDENEHYPYRKQKNVEKEGYEEVPANTNIKPKKRPILSPEELALGQELISSKKRRRELEDAAWNRYMFDDKDK